jgi:hypothetical protein
MDQEVQMKSISVISMTASILGLTVPALASAAGDHEDLLVKALLANAAGECPASIMTADMKAACDQQLPTFRDTLTRLGSIKATSFQGMSTLKNGPAEVYRVTFVHGEMTWIIDTQGDGKIRVLWAPNPPNWDIGSYSSGSAAEP